MKFASFFESGIEALVFLHLAARSKPVKFGKDTRGVEFSNFSWRTCVVKYHQFSSLAFDSSGGFVASGLSKKLGLYAGWDDSCGH